MTDEEWEEQRRRAVLAAFQTGRPVFADTDGDLHYTDGPKEQVPVDVGVARQPVPRAVALAVRAERASRFAFVMSVVAAGANAAMAYWHPWQLAIAVVLGGSAVVWHRVNRHQRDALAQGMDRGAPR